MSQETQPVPASLLQVDFTDMASYAVDLAPRERLGMRVTQEGYEEAMLELVTNQPVHGKAAGISEEDIQDITLVNERIAKIDERLPGLRKLVEVIEETRAKLDDERHRRIVELADVIDARNKKRRDTTLLAAYQKIRAYRSAIGVKAAKTRRKNAEAAEQADAQSQLEA